jgi:Protein of unknown function (DUF2442)
MNTSGHSKTEVGAVDVHFTEDMLYFKLSDGREIGVPRARYAFLANATPEQMSHWQIEPRGFAVYWPELDDGLEVIHLLSPLSVV